jgi:hypothetical protein
MVIDWKSPSGSSLNIFVNGNSGKRACTGNGSGGGISARDMFPEPQKNRIITMDDFRK